MTKLKRSMISLLLVGLCSTHSAQALAQTNIYQPRICGSYGEKVGHKALNAFGNLGGAVLELPKNIINATNQSNVFYGFTGGLFKGIVNMAGRLGVGVADLVTIPLPTKPIAYPIYIWDDFDVDSNYGDVFRLYKCPETTKPVALTSESEPYVEPTPIVVTPVPAPIVNSDLYEDTTRKIDRLFQEEMHK